LPPPLERHDQVAARQLDGETGSTLPDPELFARVVLGETAEPSPVAERVVGLEDLAAALNPLPPNDGQKTAPAAAPSQLARLALAASASSPSIPLDSPESRAGDTGFTRGLAEMRRALDNIATDHQVDMDLRAQIVAGIGASLTAGIVQWVLRAGSLMFSMASTLPIWRFFDPLPILVRDTAREEEGLSAPGAPKGQSDANASEPAVSREERVERLFESRRPLV
jgi:hypothetical protein